MKLLCWSPLYPPDVGGIEIVTERLLAGLRRRGCRCRVLTSRGRAAVDDESEREGVLVSRFPFSEALAERKALEVVRLRSRMREVVRGFGPDIVQIQFGGPVPMSFFYLQAMESSRVPTVLTFHGSVEGLRADSDAVVGRVMLRADWVTACSEAVLREVRRLSPAVEQRSSVVYYGLGPDPGHPSPLPFRPPRLLCPGRLVEEKGFDLALKALALLRRERPDLRLTLAGGGPAEASLRELSWELGVADAVEFTGEVPPGDMNRLYDAATVVVVPSRWREAFGLVAAEAAQAARPVIASRSGGLQEAVLDGVTGRLVPPEDPVAIARALAGLLDDPDKAVAMGKAGRKRALRIFDRDRYIRDYLRIYRGLLGREEGRD